MDFKHDLAELLGSNNAIAQKIAQQVKNINDALEANAISATEAEDLLKDIEVEKQLLVLADDLKAKILVQKVIDGLVSIITNFSSFIKP